MKQLQTTHRFFVFILVIALAGMLSASCAVKRVFSADSSPSLIPNDTLEMITGCKGIVEDKWTECVVDGPTKRHMIIYLPADYYRTEQSYPVVFMLHGARGNELSWITEGKVFHLIDSLVANGLAKPAIFVFPNMNQYDDDADGAASRFKQPFESFFDTDGAVETGFRQNVLEQIMNNYRTLGGRKNMAIAGLSIGAFQAAYISANEPELFGYVGLFSPFFLSYVTGGKYSKFYNGLEDKWATQFTMQPLLYFMAIGKWDFFYEHIWNARVYMTGKGYPFEYLEGNGGHDWGSWPGFFCEFYKKLF